MRAVIDTTAAESGGSSGRGKPAPSGQAAPAAGGGMRPHIRSAERARAEALDDAALLGAMRDGDAWAWGEFVVRFRPVLADYARRARVPAGVRGAFVDDVLADEAGRLAGPAACAGKPAPPNLAAYLMRAARHRFLNCRRDAAREHRRHLHAADDAGGELMVVTSLCSEHTRRASLGPGADAGAPGGDEGVELAPEEAGAGAVARLAHSLRAAVSPEESLLLAWVAARVPHRTIAEWLGVSHSAGAKRVWRLVRRLRAVALDYAQQLPAAERAELERFLRRAEALPRLAADASPEGAPPAARRVAESTPRQGVGGGDAGRWVNGGTAHHTRSRADE